MKIFSTFKNLESKSLEKFSKQLLLVGIYSTKWMPRNECLDFKTHCWKGGAALGVRI